MFRGLAFLIVLTFAFTSYVALAAETNEGLRVAIIHADHSVLVEDGDRARPKDFLTNLRQAGVLVVGRYFGRCRQRGFDHKRLIDGATPDAEANAILGAGFGIISFYQYETDDKHAVQKFTRGLQELHSSDPKVCEQTEFSKSHMTTKSGADEGTFDAQAAVAQAHAVNQPSGTPIYFGMDFEYADVKSKTLDQGIIDYFKAVQHELNKPENGYLIGAYGSGEMLSFLLGHDSKSKKEKLIDFAWISPSAGYAGTPEFTRTGTWNVLQSISDSEVSFTPEGICMDFEFDGDIQNKAAGYEYAGAWTKAGRFLLPAELTSAIYDHHGYVCAPRDVKPGAKINSCGSTRVPAKCNDSKNTGLCSARVVSIEPGKDGKHVIDLFGYGLFDGIASSDALSIPLTNRPHYSKDPNRRTCE